MLCVVVPKRVLLEELWDATSKLKGLIALHISPKIIFEVVDMVGAAKNAGFKVNWIDSVIRKIQKASDHNELIQTAKLIRAQMEEMQKQPAVIADKLK